MRINSISNISFGYNKEYHDKVEDYLLSVKRNRDVALWHLELDRLAMSLEDDIVELEKNKKTKTVGFSKMIELFTDVKNAIGYNMALNFPKLEYCDSEIEQYMDEIIRDEHVSDWKMAVCKNLASFADKDYNDCFAELEGIQEYEDSDFVPPPSEPKQEKETVDTVTALSQENIKEFLTLEVPNDYSPKGFDDVIGLDKVKDALKEDIIDYIAKPEEVMRDTLEYGLKAPRGLLLYGPPGCGKTMLTKALAAETGLPLYKMDISKLGSKYVNQTANNIQEAFDYLIKITSGTGKPVLLFIDEADSIATTRSNASESSVEDAKATTTLLKIIEQARENNIIPIAATNKYGMLDSAFINRFDGEYYIPLPDEKQIKNLIIHLLSMRAKGELLAKNEESIDTITKDFKGYSNRSITFIIDKASKIARKDNRSDIKIEHIKQAIKELDIEKINEKEYLKDSKKRNHLGF